MNEASTEIVIRNFQEEDKSLLGELHQAVTAQENAVFWWVGEEENWCNVYCAFEAGKMIAKGQVSIVNSIPPGRAVDTCHSIYINLKTTPDREQDYALLHAMYQKLYIRAKQLKEGLSREYETILCVGNDSTEVANNEFFVQKGYAPLNRLYGMNRDLNESIIDVQLPEGFEFSYWKMGSAGEEQEYLDVEMEIWPDAPLIPGRLAEYKSNRHWTSMVIRHAGTIVGGLMAWQEDDHGIIEDVFVRRSWRNRGLAKYLLVQALIYLKTNELHSAHLEVVTTNQSALSLYQSVGFHVDSEEIRYFIQLN